MLPRVHRLRDSEDFSLTVRHGRKSGRASLVVHAWDAPTSVGAPRVGFVVSKAVGPAVERNRVKRRLRHLMATRMSYLRPGLSVVVRALPPSATTSSARLELDLREALAGAGVR